MCANSTTALTQHKFERYNLLVDVRDGMPLHPRFVALLSPLASPKRLTSITVAPPSRQLPNYEARWRAQDNNAVHDEDRFENRGPKKLATITALSMDARGAGFLRDHSGHVHSECDCCVLACRANDSEEVV